MLGIWFSLKRLRTLKPSSTLAWPSRTHCKAEFCQKGNLLTPRKQSLVLILGTPMLYLGVGLTPTRQPVVPTPPPPILQTT
ncbi:hypothetical protein RHMOL_Rhmol07G0199300 [Rhododendron molle]|uniref:Uncharacterized protein n=1 Tax=Rhododendron molle TaxID=49168 RepID=A0ACC0N492_RHOML|nr:hypothetical protein RHMOL_Rhmol07G0199300 [Rhododendron molle]